jgi:uncharacterized delta-60 repeat protein
MARDVTEPGTLAVQGDGKIVLAGWTASDRDPGDFALARYTRDGRLDRTFGRGGKVVTDFGSHSDDGADAIAIQRDGKIVLGGATSRTEDAPNDWALVRYTANGRLDRSFGVGGKLRTDFGTEIDDVAALAIQGDGKIVAAGESASDFALARYLQDGTLDPSFGAAGKVLTEFDSRESVDGPVAVVVQSDGKIVAGGSSADDRGDFPGPDDFVLVRYTPQGRLDESFGQAGIALTDFGAQTSDEAWALAIQRDGKIVAAGASSRDEDAPGDFALARYTLDGNIDPSFGSGGTVLTGFGRDSWDGASGVALEADGRIVAAGATERGAHGGDFALAAYEADGRLDRSFGKSGTVVTDFAGARTRVVSLSATRTRRGVRVRWHTAGEIGTRGFNVYRQTKAAWLGPLNRKPVHPEGSVTRGASYSFLDPRAARTRGVEYWIEDLRRSGERARYGPIAVEH